MAVVGVAVVGSSDPDTSAIVGTAVPADSPIVIERELYAGPMPWLDNAAPATGEPADTATAERSSCVKAYAFDEETWTDIEEIDGVTTDSNLTWREQDHFIQQDVLNLVIDDPTGQYIGTGGKAYLLELRKLVRLERVTWNETEQIISNIGVYRVAEPPKVDHNSDDGEPKLTWVLQDWAREKLERKMPMGNQTFNPNDPDSVINTGWPLYPLGYLMWKAQGFTDPLIELNADLFHFNPEPQLNEIPEIMAAGDALFSGIPFPTWQYAYGYNIPSPVTVPDDLATTEGDWQYTLLGYIFMNLYYLLDGKFTIDGPTFTNAALMMAFGKPPDYAASTASVNARQTSRFGPRVDVGSGAASSADIAPDPILVYQGEFFWGNPDEWPSWREFLQALFMQDPQTYQSYWCFTYGTFPGKMYYDSDGVVHLIMVADKAWHGVGWSCNEPRGQTYQLPLESLSRQPSHPEYNRVLIQRWEIVPPEVTTSAPDPSDPFGNNTTTTPTDQPQPMAIAPPAASAFVTELVTYANVKANTSWYHWQPALDKVYILGPNVPFNLVQAEISGYWNDADSRMRYRAALAQYATMQATYLLKIYLARAYVVTISLSNAVPVYMSDVILLYDPAAGITGYFRIISMQMQFDDQPQSLDAEWVDDA